MNRLSYVEDFKVKSSQSILLRHHPSANQIEVARHELETI